MVDTSLSFQIVLFTEHYSITGGLFLREQRLSDFLNDRRDSTILLRNASMARLEDPAKIIEKTPFSIIPKAGIVLAFEPPQKTTPTGRQVHQVSQTKIRRFPGDGQHASARQIERAGPAGPAPGHHQFGRILHPDHGGRSSR